MKAHVLQPPKNTLKLQYATCVAYYVLKDMKLNRNISNNTKG